MSLSVLAGWALVMVTDVLLGDPLNPFVMDAKSALVRLRSDECGPKPGMPTGSLMVSVRPEDRARVWKEMEDKAWGWVECERALGHDVQ